MSLVLDWLFGGNDHYKSPYLERLDEIADAPRSHSDAAPILKLNSAILSQAVSGQATRIDIMTGVPNLEVHQVETSEAYAYRKKMEDPESEEYKKATKFQRIMAGTCVRPQ